MKAPESLETLLDYGIIQEVIRPLMSGKEAHVYVVVAGGEECVAKVYKEAHQRTFKHRSDYTEGRRTRNTRDQRAMSKRTQHGRKKDEDAWRSTEVEMIYRLRDAGVRVPEPINFVEGVLVMELVKDAEGHAAPRLGDLTFSASEAHEIYQGLMREIVRMLCAGVIHGDLSEFNVLMSREGPVVIDFPQSVEPTHNPNGKKLLLRDVENLHRFLARFAPDQPVLPYGEEIWSLFQKNCLEPDTVLTGHHAKPIGKANTEEVMALIEDASRDEKLRRSRYEPEDDEEFEATPRVFAKAPAPFRTVVDFAPKTSARATAGTRDRKKRGARSSGPATRRRRPTKDKPVPPTGPASRPSRNPARDGSQQRPGNETASADRAKPAASSRRRRRTRGRSRTRASSEAKPEVGKTGSSAARNVRNPAAPRTAKRPVNASRSSGSARPPGEAGGVGRPARRRRRRSRKASLPE